MGITATFWCDKISVLTHRSITQVLDSGVEKKAFKIELNALKINFTDLCSCFFL